MKHMKWIPVSMAAAGLAAAVVLAPKPATINGKRYANAALVQGGKTYIAVDALKAAGAQVTNNASGVTVNFAPLGGRNQVDAVEGKLEEWIQNDQWRIRVESVKEGPNPFGRGPGMVAKVEFRNLATRPLSPFGSGMDKLQIIDKNQAVLTFSQSTFKHFFRDVAPGGSVVEEIAFGDQQNQLAALGEPDKLMVFFRMSGGKKSKDFRVFLK